MEISIPLSFISGLDFIEVLLAIAGKLQNIIQNILV